MRPWFCAVWLVIFAGLNVIAWSMALNSDAIYSSPPVASIIQKAYQLNIAFDKVVYGSDSLFQAREETGMALEEYLQANGDQTRKLLEHALAIRTARRPPYDEVIWRAQRHLGRFYFWTGESTKSREILESALDNALRNHPDGGTQLCDSLQALAYTAADQSDYASAEKYFLYRKQLEQLDYEVRKTLHAKQSEREACRELVSTLLAMAAFYIDTDEKQKAKEAGAEARRIATHGECADELTNTDYARVLLLEGRVPEAKRVIDSYVEENRGHWQNIDIVPALLVLSDCYRAENNSRRAHELVDEALNTYHRGSIKNASVLSSIYLHQAILALDAKQYSAAITACQQCKSIWTPFGERGHYVQLAERISRAAEARSTERQELVAMRRTESAAALSPPPAVLPIKAARIHSFVMQPAIRTDIYNTAVKYFEKKLAKVKPGDRVERTNVTLQLANALLAAGDKENAEKQYDAAIAMLSQSHDFGKPYISALAHLSAIKLDGEERLPIYREARRRAEQYSSSDPLFFASILEAGPAAGEEFSNQVAQLRRALQIRTKIAGPNSDSASSTMLQLSGSMRLLSNSAASEALSERAKDILIKKFIRDFRRDGPISENVMNDYLVVNTFPSRDGVEDYCWRKAIFGPDHVATAHSAFKAAQVIDNLSADKDSKRQPNVIGLALPLLFLLGFGSIFIFVQRVDSRYHEKSDFAYDKNWLLVFRLGWILCAALVGLGTFQAIEAGRQKPWNQAASKELRLSAIRVFKANALPATEEYGRAALLLGSVLREQGDKKEAEKYLREAAAVLESKNPLINEEELTEVYDALIAIAEEEGRADDKESWTRKKTQLGRAGDELKEAKE